ncbi:hit family protein [Xylariomycetidae sp. FL0641]|nr:hit family protein [Xylariomycetidae sp. FL0641]
MSACIFCKIIKGKSPTYHLHHAEGGLGVEGSSAASAHSRRKLSPTTYWDLLTPTTGEIPCFKLFESEKTLAFLDISPLSKGHALVIPKFHGEKLADIPDEHLGEILPVAKKLVQATGATNYNILQNNGRIAHQVVDHVHFHMIPKPDEKQGLGIGWPQQPTDMEALKALFEEIKAKM